MGAGGLHEANISPGFSRANVATRRAHWWPGANWAFRSPDRGLVLRTRTAGRLGAESLPGVVFAPNLTPDAETGLGEWTRRDIAAAIQTGVDHNGGRLRLVMPWANYSVLTERDTLAIAAYLRSLDPVSNRVPDPVPAGARSGSPYVRFGVYLFSPDGDLVEQPSGSPTGGLR